MRRAHHVSAPECRWSMFPSSKRWLHAAIVVGSAVVASTPLVAQQRPLQPGEGYVTRFSGTVPGPAGSPIIDTAGTVGSIIDLRSPYRPPRGEHWMDEPQRNPVTAGLVGQVFGVVLDDATPPNIYVNATAAFGLHLSPGTHQWMAGMWGRGGGPGTIYRLDAANNYQPRVFSNVTLNGRPNTGAALGNMTFDRINKQIFVSDLETGMITRINATTGAAQDVFDHGTQGRPKFTDVATRQQQSLPAIAFDPSSRARISDCPSGAFEQTLECWNIAASGRRVWGIGVYKDTGRNEQRLYYAVWSGPAFGASAWSGLSDEEKRNAIWSIRIAPGGAFDPSDVRREFLLPDFFVKPEDIARAGYSQPVSDITFSECGPRPVMLLAERGGLRNLGLAAENAFATPHESRALRYEMDQAGGWQPVGRYDIGYYDRRQQGEPFMRANCAGGVSFGYGYNGEYSNIDPSKLDQFVWTSGDALCSMAGPCRAPAALQAPADASEVHGIQGTPEPAFARVAPPEAFTAYPQTGEPTPAAGPDQSYLIDTDINVDAQGTPIALQFERNDATRIGDVAIYVVCAPPPPLQPTFLLPPPGIQTLIPPSEGHNTAMTHAQVSSHGERSSHFRVASHNYWQSHNAEWSHNRWRSHNEIISTPVHRPPGSIHRPPGSIHRPPGSIHRPPGSIHRPAGSIHRPPGSIHRPPGSIHRPPGSVHTPPGSVHRPPGSVHTPPGSTHKPPGSLHKPPGSVVVHRPPGSVHTPPGSTHKPPGSLHKPPGSVVVHRPPGSVHTPPGSTHKPPGSLHKPPGSVVVHKPPGSVHRPAGSVHKPPGSVHRPAGSVNVHKPVGSVRVHQPPGSVRVHRPAGSVRVHQPPGSVRVHRPAGSVRVHQPPGSARVQRPVGPTRKVVCRMVNGKRVCN